MGEEACDLGTKPKQPRVQSSWTTQDSTECSVSFSSPSQSQWQLNVPKTVASMGLCLKDPQLRTLVFLLYDHRVHIPMKGHIMNRSGICADEAESAGFEVPVRFERPGVPTKRSEEALPCIEVYMPCRYRGALPCIGVYMPCLYPAHLLDK